MVINPNTAKIVDPPPLYRVRAACEPQDREFYLRYREGGGRTVWDKQDWLVAIRVLSSLEDDLELDPSPRNQTTKRAQAKAMRRVRRLLETHVGDVPGKKVEVRKKFPLAGEWKNQT